MANEAVLIENPTKFVRATVANTGTIAKGTLMQISSDPNTVTASSGADVFAGILWTEKLTGDGSTNVGLAIDGEWDLVVAPGAAVTLGSLVSLSGVNLIKTATEAEIITGKVIGKCL